MSAPAICPANAASAKSQPAPVHAQPHYPELLIQRVVERVGLSYRVQALALGAAPGWLALAFAPFAKSITLLGEHDALLSRSTSQPALCNKLRVEPATTLRELPEQLGRFRLALLGSPFRRLDRAATLAALDTRLDVGGAFSLFELRHPNIAENRFRHALDALLLAYERERGAVSRTETESDEAVLLQSAFDHVERLSLLERRDTPVQVVIERALVGLGIAQDTSGAREQRLARDLYDALAEHASGTLLSEVVDAHVLIARRAKDLSGRWV